MRAHQQISRNMGTKIHVLQAEVIATVQFEQGIMRSTQKTSAMEAVSTALADEQQKRAAAIEADRREVIKS
jgi:hypothetical protein